MDDLKNTNGIVPPEEDESEFDADAITFAQNPDPRCACVLLLDVSGSMRGEPIRALNSGLQTFKTELMKDPLAQRRVEVAVVTFDSTIDIVCDFVTADQFQPPSLIEKGLTHTGSGILKALDMVETRKATYKQNGVAYYRPWIFLITDGLPYGEPENVLEEAKAKIAATEAAKGVTFFAVGVEGADRNVLKSISPRVQMLAGLNFADLFVWLSASMSAISKSQQGEKVGLPQVGWAEVET